VNEDPGWPMSWRTFLIFVPGGAQYTQRNAPDGLVAMRSVFLSLCLALLAFGIVIPFVADPTRGGWFWPTAVIAVGLATQVAVTVADGPLDCTSTTTLATSYRSRFFLRLALSESAALFGFVGSFLGPWWTYYVGVAFAIVGFVRTAPTVRVLAAEQERLARSGCFQSLVAALRAPMPGSG
jgi:F0F1-type ATP synthase membrane subunit c/vacuolar-type H+-ATPase subunit K